jgi:hypothetical protein
LRLYNIDCIILILINQGMLVENDDTLLVVVQVLFRSIVDFITVMFFSTRSNSSSIYKNVLSIMGYSLPSRQASKNLVSSLSSLYFIKARGNASSTHASRSVTHKNARCPAPQPFASYNISNTTRNQCGYSHRNHIRQHNPHRLHH